MILIDKIIFNLQKRGGISTLFNFLIKNLANDFEMNFINNSYIRSNFPRFCSLFPINIENKNLLFLSSYLTYPNKKFNGSFVFIVHDCMNELFSSYFKKLYVRYLNKKCLSRASGIIFVSDQTKLDYEFFYPNSKKIPSVVIQNPTLKKPIFKNDFNHKNYLVFLGSRNLYKNFDLAVRVAKIMSLELVIIGGGKFSKSELLLLKEHSVMTKFLGFVDEDVVSSNLYNATALIYPSLYEGFGFPIIEAQALGCPVITCENSKGVKETSGGSTLNISNNLFSEDIKNLKLLITSIKYRRNLCNKGYKNIKRFSKIDIYEKYKIFLSNY